MTDIVERLNRFAKYGAGVAVLIDAASEIERLRQTIRDTVESLERNSTSAPVVECLKAALTPAEGKKP